MFIREENRYHIVYPSWARLSYKWPDLARILSSPLESGYLDPRKDWRGMGYPEAIQSFQLADGPTGGGIISVEASPTEKWMPGAVLSKEANIRLLPGELSVDQSVVGANVYYLEPRHGPLGDFPFLPDSMKDATVYVCGTSLEHVAGSLGSTYWLLGYRRGKRELPGLDQLVGWASRLGIDIEMMSAIPDSLIAETSTWFVEPKYDYRWFEVRDGASSLGYLYAVVVYLAYHLRWLGGSRVFCMHLVSEIDGKPNSRIRWYKK